jgi:CBS domain-containing protein
MRVSDVMTRAVDFVDPTATVQAAAIQMAELDVGAVIVGTADRIEGILTDRDIIVRLVVEGLNPARIGVRDIMTPDVISCRADEDVEQAFAAMREGQFRRMPVLNGEGKLVGVVTMSDLAKHVESPEKVAEKLREISEPHRSREAPEEIPPAAEGAAGTTETEDKRKASAA